MNTVRQTFQRVDGFLDFLTEKLTPIKPHLIAEARNPDADFHRQTVFPERKISFEHPLEIGQRVTAEIALEVVRNGERVGNTFVSDQGEIFEIERVTKWKT